MPRLDNSDPRNLEVLQEWGDRHWLNEKFDPRDPGDTSPMDVCLNCMREYFPWEDGRVDHPPYLDDDYTCAVCQNPLYEEDDG